MPVGGVETEHAKQVLPWEVAACGQEDGSRCREVGFWRAGDKRDLSINIIARLVHGLFWMLSSPKRRINTRFLMVILRGFIVSIDDFP